MPATNGPAIGVAPRQSVLILFDALLSLIVALQESKVRKALAQLLKRGLIAETKRPPAGTEWRTDGNLRFGLVLSDPGRGAMGVTAQYQGGEAEPLAPPDQSSINDSASAPSATAAQPTTKSATVIGLMSRDEGATLAELVEATGWLPHTTRAALTGLRKKGHDLVKGKRGDVTCYNVAQAAA